MNTEAEMPQATPEKGRRSQTAWIVVLVVFCLAGALWVKYRLGQFADPDNYDSSPLPRPTVNAPFIVTPDSVVDKMIEMAQISNDDLVYDLGCGDGRLVISAAARSGCRGIGFDIEPQRVAEATENAKLNQVDKLVEIREQDVFTVDLREADAVLMYLLPQMLRDLVPNFDKCQPGTRLVSHDFTIEGVQVDKTEHVYSAEDDREHSVHLYVTPLKKLPPKPPRKQASRP